MCIPGVVAAGGGAVPREVGDTPGGNDTVGITGKVKVGIQPAKCKDTWSRDE